MRLRVSRFIIWNEFPIIAHVVKIGNEKKITICIILNLHLMKDVKNYLEVLYLKIDMLILPFSLSLLTQSIKSDNNLRSESLDLETDFIGKVENTYA